MKPDLVAITGVTGYVGSEICLQALQAGYRVRGIVRNLKSANSLKDSAFPHKENIEMVEASLCDPLDKWEECLKGVDYVIDVASPVDFNMPEAEMVNVATKGVENVMKAAIKNKVKKVVYTSSVAACGQFDKRINEDSWNDLSKAMPYPKSKTSAEKLAWQIYKEQKEEEKTELTCILPVFVLGPSIHSRILSTMNIIKMMVQNKMLIANCSLSMVDIRDVAKAHLISLKEKVTDGQRYILHNKAMWLKDIAKVMHDEASKYGLKVNHTCCWDIKVKILAKFIKVLSFFANNLGIIKEIDNSKSIKELKMDYIPIEKTLLESMYFCIHHGALN